MDLLCTQRTRCMACTENKQGMQEDGRPKRKRTTQTMPCTEIDVRDPSAGYSALHCAVIECDLEQVKSLLANGADVNIRDCSGRTPIFYIDGQSDDGCEIIKTLLEARPQLEIHENKYRMTPIMEIVYMTRCIRTVKMLLDYGVDFNARENHGDTLLHDLACKQSDNYYIGLIRDMNFDPNVRNEFGDSPLHIAVQCDNLEFAALLLEKGADPNLKAKNGLTPMFVTRSGRSTMKLLLEHGADIQTLLPSGETIVGYATREHDFWIIEMKPVLEKLAIQEAKGLPILERLLEDIRAHALTSNYYDDCKQEIERMHSLKCNGNVSFHNILFNSVSKVSKYARDTSFVENFKKSDVDVKFPKYAELLKVQFEKAKEMHQLKQNTANVLCDSLQLFDSNHIVIEKVISYLTIKDLLQLL